MPEYIRITPEYDPDDPNVLHLVTNLTLTRGEEEVYASPEEGDIGAPLAQLIFMIDGVAALTITPDTFIVTRESAEVDWYILIDEISTAVKDFYL